MNIDKFLKNNKITKVMLANQLGISREYLYRMLANPTDSFLDKLADVFGVSPLELKQDELTCSTSISAIALLPFEQWRFIKRINIVAPRGPERNLEVGYIIYERRFRADYKLRERQNGESEFNHLLTFDKQENFPQDYLDNIILDGIRQDYPDSYVSNYMITADCDLKTIDVLQQLPRKDFMIIFNLSAPIAKLMEDNNRGISHYYIWQKMPFYRTSCTSFSEHIVSATAYFDLEHEQEVCERFDRKEILFL